MVRERMTTILITQCLQRDFVDPIGPHDPLPNLLHVGYGEAARLLGPEPSAEAMGPPVHRAPGPGPGPGRYRPDPHPRLARRRRPRPARAPEAIRSTLPARLRRGTAHPGHG